MAWYHHFKSEEDRLIQQQHQALALQARINENLARDAKGPPAPSAHQLQSARQQADAAAASGGLSLTALLAGLE